jgi:hypothetical protein
MSCSWPVNWCLIWRVWMSQTWDYVSCANYALEEGFTHANDLVLGTGRQVLAAGAEADTPDVQVTVFW